MFDIWLQSAVQRSHQHTGARQGSWSIITCTVCRIHINPSRLRVNITSDDTAVALHHGL